jgi:hypothetical protein
MITIKKIRGKDEIAPIKVSHSEYMYIKNLGYEIEDYIRMLVEQIARARRWKWWFDKKDNNANN